MLTSTAELDKIIDKPNLILIDARSFQEYSQGHITNAINLDLFSFHWIDTSQNGISSFNEQFGMAEKSGCDLAVRIDGKSYFVDGTNIHEHGDAHADDGFCEVIRNANVKGEIIEGRFKSESFILIK